MNRRHTNRHKPFNDMKHIIITAATASTILLLASSCSIIKPKASNTVKGSSATLVVYPSTTTGNTEDIEAGGPGPVISVPEQETAPEVAAESSALAPHLNGQWEIIQAGAATIDRDEDMPYITFEPSTGRFYANDGCNTINGSYKLKADDTIVFYGVLSTLKLCEPTVFEHVISAVLDENNPSKLKLTNIGSESFISFFDVTGKEIMKIRHSNLEFLNGNWKVESIAGIDKLEAQADVFFDLNDLKIHGNTGCNYFNGTIYLDRHAGNAIDFSNMALTRMACPYSAQESAMILALESTATAIQGGENTVMLLDAEGHELMTLSRLPLENAE